MLNTRPPVLVAFFHASTAHGRFSHRIVVKRKPCFGMPATIKQIKVFFFATVLFPVLLSVFVAGACGIFLRSALKPVIAALAGPEIEPATPVTTSFPLASILATCLLLVAAAMFVAAIVIWRRAKRSDLAIQTCSRNGTVILEPSYSFAITRYLYGQVAVDLSRTNFANYQSDDFPLEKIYRLETVRIRETHIPDSIVKKLLACEHMKNLDLSNSSISQNAAQWLTELGGVEFQLEGLMERDVQPQIIEICSDDELVGASQVATYRL